MAGLSDVLEVAKRALIAQRLGLDITSNNIANASTPSFSRQRVDFAETPAVRTKYGLIGTGVTASHIGRVRERFIDQQVRAASDTFGYATTQQRILSQVEAAVNEPSDNGIATAMSRFFNAFQDLSVHPEESALRNSVLQQGTILAQGFHRLNANIKQLRGDLANDVEGKLRDINQLTKDISELDIKITNAMAEGLDPSALKDQRDIKIDALAKLVKVNVSEDTNGSVMVSVGGTVIASRAGAVTLNSAIVGNRIKIYAGNSTQETPMLSGELGGVLEAYNTTLPDYLTKLDQAAKALIDRVNALHVAGFGLDKPPSTGNNFFTGTSAENIDIDPAVANNTNNIAASLDGKPGNNEIALAIANVRNEALLNGNTTSIPQLYNTFVSTVGTAITATDNTMRNQELILTQLENQRTAVSGVSIDEEMTNLIKYQRSFDAAAKVVAAVDDLFRTIIQMVR